MLTALRLDQAMLTALRLDQAMLTALRLDQAMLTALRLDQAMLTALRLDQAMLTALRLDQAMLTHYLAISHCLLRQSYSLFHFGSDAEVFEESLQSIEEHTRSSTVHTVPQTTILSTASYVRMYTNVYTYMYMSTHYIQMHT